MSKDLTNYIEKKDYKKYIIIIMIFILIGLIITTTILIIINDIIDKVNNSSAIISTSVSKTNYEYDINESLKVLKIPSSSSNHHITYDNKYSVYFKDNDIQIMDISNNDNKYTNISDKNEIIYFDLAYKSNKVIYLTKESNSFGNEIILKIYDIPSKTIKEYNKLIIDNFSNILNLEFNLDKGYVYINIENKTLTSINNIMYKLNLNDLRNEIISEKLINKILLLKNSNDIYYSDIENNIYDKNNDIVDIFNVKVEIIGSDKDDNIYYLDKTNNSKIFKVNNNIVIEEIMLTDSDLTSYYSDKNKVYLIYPTYVMDISSNNKYERIFKLSSDLSFISIINNIIYLKSNNGNILFKEIK